VALRDEVIAMRERLREAHPCPADQFDIKHSHGGMIDVEFAVQYLVLTHSHAHPELLDNVGNIALLQRAEDAGLLPAGVGPCRRPRLSRTAPHPAPGPPGRGQHQAARRGADRPLRLTAKPC
jgi:hypothetical protein